MDYFTAALSGRWSVAVGKGECSAASYGEVDRLTLRAYDVPLMLLIDWMLDADSGRRATITDVIRHPSFMGNHETEAFALALHGGLFESLVVKTAFDEQHALREMSDVLYGEMGSMFDALKTVPDADDDDEENSEDCESSSDGDDGSEDDGTDPLKRFARAAHKFFVRNGHTSGGNAVDGGAVCNSTRTPNLHPERLQLESAFPKSQHKGLVRRAFTCCPGAFTFVDEHKLFAHPAFSFDHSASASDGEDHFDIYSRCAQVLPAPLHPCALR